MTSEWDTDIATELIVGNFPAGGFIDIGANVPAELITYYSTNYNGSITKAWIKFQQGPTFYSYIVAFQTAPLGTDAALAYGHVHNLVVFEEKVSFLVPVAVPPLPQVQVHHGVHTQMYETWGNPSAGATDPLTQLYFQNAQLFMQTTANGRTAGADWQIDGHSQGRGYWYDEQITVVFNTAALVAETVAWTSATNITFRAGRAYAVKVHTQIHSATVQSPVVHIRKTNVIGNILISGPRVNLPNGNDFPVYRENIILNATAGDISAAICLTILPQVAAVVTLNGAAQPTESWARIMDVGAAADFTAGIQI